MGKGQSKTRTTSFENDTPAGLIDISEDVVNRLKSDMQKEREVTRAEARESQKQQQQARPASTNPAAGPTTIVYQGGTTMTALQVRKDKEAELFANDQYWANRLKNQEAEFLKNSKIMEKEFNETMGDIKKRFAQQTLASQKAPCQDLKSKVVECYKKNPLETLKCAAEVKEFLDCVNSSRMDAIDAKQKPAASA